MRSARLKIALAFLLAALLLGVLTLVFWDFARETIITPIYYAVWVAGLVLKSISDGAYLALLLLICGGLGLGALANSVRGKRRQRFQAAAASAETRYHHWERLCANLYFSRFSRHLFLAEARRLIVALLAFEYRRDPDVIAMLVEDGQIALPATIRALLLGGDDLPGTQPFGWRDRLAQWLRREPPSDPQTDALLDEIITFIESHLEIVHVSNQPEARN